MLREQVEGKREVLGEGETVRQVLEDVIARYPSLRDVLFEQDELTPFVNVYVGRARRAHARRAGHAGERRLGDPAARDGRRLSDVAENALGNYAL